MAGYLILANLIQNLTCCPYGSIWWINYALLVALVAVTLAYWTRLLIEILGKGKENVHIVPPGVGSLVLSYEPAAMNDRLDPSDTSQQSLPKLILRGVKLVRGASSFTEDDTAKLKEV